MFERTVQGTIHQIRGNDPLDIEHLDRVAVLFDQCLQQGQPRVVLDLEKVPLIDSAGLEMLLDVQERFQQRGGALKICGPNTLCQDILAITGVERHFEVFYDAISALGSFAQ